MIIADIPGIIEGASEGRGLGIRFLKHISRTAGLIFMLDCSDVSCRTAYKTLVGELGGYSADLLEKPRLVLCNKIDVEGAEENARAVAEELRAAEPNVEVVPVSLAGRRGVEEAKRAILRLAGVAAGGFASERQKAAERSSSFLASRSVDGSMGEQAPGSER